MVWEGFRRRSASMRLALCAGLPVVLAGCTSLPVSSPAPGGAADAVPVASTSSETLDGRDSRPAAAAATAAAPDAAPSAATAGPLTVAILYSAGVPTQAAIAAQIAEGLSAPAYTVRRVDIDGSGSAALIDIAAEAEVRVVAAVGPAALDIARDRFGNAEIVFSQVLEPDRDSDAASRIRGVAPTPPPALQFAAWAEVDPGLERIGLITSEAFATVVPDAEAAAAAIGAALVHRVSSSDRETLYLFRRLAPAIDGLWLVPDREILSPTVIEEMLALAAGLHIGVLVFSETLLDRGGLITVDASVQQVAATVIRTIEQIRAGEAHALPAEIPLNQGVARVNARVAAQLGLPAATALEWVIDAGS